MPPDDEAVKVAYADSSGITVYGSASTRFLYVVTNEVRGGKVREGIWRASELPPGDYTLRIIAADYAGNEADAGRDLPIRIKNEVKKGEHPTDRCDRVASARLPRSA